MTEVAFKEGQEVKAGDLLAVIDPRPYQVALEQAQGQLAQSQAQLAQARSDLARYETLSKQDSIALQQVDTQRALVDQYDGLVKTNQAAVDNAKLNLVYCHITAPVTGRVGLRLVDPGNYVTPGTPSGLVTLTQMQPISVIFTLPEDAYSQVAARLRSGARSPSTPTTARRRSKQASGTLEAIDNQADTDHRDVQAPGDVSQRGREPVPQRVRQRAHAARCGPRREVIPSSAIELGQQGTYVYVVQEGDTVTARAVKLGPTQGERVAVTSGLNVGDRVVVDGADRLKEGGRVTVQQAGAAAGQGAGAPASGSQAGQHRWNGGSEAAGQRPAGGGGSGS